MVRIAGGKTPDVGLVLEQRMKSLVEGMEELEVAELTFSLHVADVLEPRAEIDIVAAGLLQIAEALDHCVIQLADVIHRDTAAEADFQFVGQTHGVAVGRTHMSEA